MKEEIIKKAIERLEDTKASILVKIALYKEKIKRYKESNEELEDNQTVEVYNEKIEKWTKSLQACKDVKETVENISEGFVEQNNLVHDLINYNLTFGSPESFLNKVFNVDGFNVNELYDDCTRISKATTVKFPMRASDISNFNQYRGLILMKADVIDRETYILGKTNANKIEVCREIQKMLNSPKILNFYKSFIDFFEETSKTVDLIAKENGEKIQEIRDSEIQRRKDEVKNNINELNRKIEECNNSLQSINNIFKLYEEYNLNPTNELLIELTGELTNLVVISQRESKLITYEAKEKEIPVEEEKTILEKNEEIEDIKPVELDNDYFRNPNTNYLICFLGDENNTINEDIDYHFDKSNIKPVLSELYYVFTTLTTKQDYIKDKGGNPHEGCSKKALKLLQKPFDFSYKRFGVRNDKFRIHAISRYSNLLKELGYGSGNIIFFGAVGVNDDKEKSDAYNRLGTRAIDQLSNKNDVPKLRPNFDFIEHITRGYIPKKLFSDEDIKKSEKGMFLAKLKGNIDMSIEHGRFVLYDLLDDTTKSNVKKYLDDYFIKQTNMLFEIKDKYDKAIGDYS